MVGIIDRLGGRLAGKASKQIPAGRILAFEADGLGQIVDRLLVLLSDVLAFRNPEEFLRNDARERGAVFLLGDPASC